MYARIERYAVRLGPDGVTIRMRQARNAVVVGGIAAGVTLLSWWLGPYGPRPLSGLAPAFYWLWTGIWVLFAVLSAAGALYRQDWTISETEVRRTTSFQPLPVTVRRGQALRFRLLIPRLDTRRHGAIFPYRLQVLTPAGEASGLQLDFAAEANARALVSALAMMVPVALDEAAAAA